MAFPFENLNVYEKALNLSDDVFTLTRSFPRGYFMLADQLNRAALAIAAKIAEGSSQYDKQDRKYCYASARGNVYECVPLLEIALRQDMLQAEHHNRMKAELEDIAKMLSGLINAQDKREK